MTVTINGTSGVVCPAGGTVNVAGSGVGTTDIQTLTNKTINGGAITSGTAQATTSGTAVGFTGIPSWVKRITFQLVGVYNSSGTVATNVIQIGSGSYVTTGYTSAYAYFSNSTPISAATTNGFVLYGNTVSFGLYGNIILTLANASTNTWVASGTACMNNTFNSTNGSISLSGVLDRIQITATSGAFSGGSVNILYEG